ncbi:MAG TPA: peptide MFS transporter [Blastocatellia bacterium]|nr:peptide MFS transporter [Blastocatellia bacterium]
MATTPEAGNDTSGIGGHPAGLTTLFFTEMWERFSYYGMRAILILFMVAPISDGGLGFDTAKAAVIYGTYTASVYLLSLPGGWVADNLLGARLTVLLGGITIALGHFSMAFASMPAFYSGLVLIVLGTGMLKPNISTMVGSLYSEDDPRRDAGFSIFYMGINLGAFIAPFVCGTLAQSQWFKDFLGRMGFHPEGSWHWGFAAAGIGMTLGVIQYLAARKRLEHVGKRPKERKADIVRKESQANPSQPASQPELESAATPSASASSSAGVLKALTYLFRALAVIFGIVAVIVLIQWAVGSAPLLDPAYILSLVLGAFVMVLLSSTANYFQEVMAKGETKRAAEEGKRMAVIGILFIFSALFWMAFEQAGSSLNLFADKLTRTSIFGFSFPSSWFQSVNSIFIIALAPVFSWIWLSMKNRQPSSPAKFAYGLLFVGLGFLVIAYASSLTGGGQQVSPMWLILVYLFHTIGELCLSPVGLSMVTKLAPARLLGMMMGVWFLSISLGNYVAGAVAGNFDPNTEGALVRLFGKVALTTIIAAVILAALTPKIRKLMGRVH